MTDEKKINIVLAGQGNSGKSSIFNYLTGLHQHIGNWAGKTIEKLEGTLYYKGYTIDVLDLPGIYSLTAYSVEEVISREYIIHHKPDFVINLIDSTNLERNLIFTLQLLELEYPVVLVLNMIDLAHKKGVDIDLPYPKRWIAIKLLEKDKDITGLVQVKRPEVLEKVKQLGEDLEEIHGHDSSIVIADERSHLASQITREIIQITPHKKLSLNERLD